MNSDIRILDLEVHFRYKKHRSTLKFGGAVKGPPPRSGADLHVSALVETRDGRRGEGHAGTVLGSSWSWPSTSNSRPHATSSRDPWTSPQPPG